MRLKDPDKRAVIGDSGDDRIEDRPYATLHDDSGQALGHLTFYFSRRVFFLRAVRGDGGQFVIGIRIWLARKHRFDQALRDNVGEAAVRRGGVRVVLYRKAKVTGSGFSGGLQNILTGTDEFDNGKGEVGKVIGIRSLAPQQEIVQRF